jgi:hypothetical protein
VTHHDDRIGTGDLADKAKSPSVSLEAQTDLELEVLEAFVERLLQVLGDFFVGCNNNQPRSRYIRRSQSPCHSQRPSQPIEVL